MNTVASLSTLTAKRQEIDARMGAVSDELVALGRELTEAHREFNRDSKMAFMDARDHVDSAWRSVEYAKAAASGR